MAPIYRLSQSPAGRWPALFPLLFALALAACSGDEGTPHEDGGTEEDAEIDASPPPDDDGDGFPNVADNCKEDPNPGQQDADDDGYGDACDNCPPLPNQDQADDDGDGEGDECEGKTLPGGDLDGDGVANDEDLCPEKMDPDNADSDGDGWGDVCDNCPMAANSDQANADSDADGDACDTDAPSTDTDGDGIIDRQDRCPELSSTNNADADKDLRGDACDNCPMLANYSQTDTDGDGAGDLCDDDMNMPDGDDDGDGIPNSMDKCPGVDDPDNTDSDGDGWADPCDNCKQVANSNQDAQLKPADLALCNGSMAPDPEGDDDGDTVKNSEDKCPGTKPSDTYTPASQRLDTDGDGVGDGCDNCPMVANYSQNAAACAVPDTDMDGVPNGTDNCISVMNANQADADMDKVGDACDNCPMTANSNQQNGDGDATGDKCDPSLGTGAVCAQGTTSANPIKPDLYFLLDRSQSMVDNNVSSGVTRFAALKEGLNTLANTTALASNFHLAVGAFPAAVSNGNSCSSSNLPQQLLTMGARTTAQFTGSYASLSAGGYTPTDVALDRIRTQQLYNFAGDPHPNGPKAVVLVTDGEPNDCTDSGARDDNRIDQTVTAAAALAAAGVPVYVLAFTGVDEPKVQRIADAGDPAPGTNTWYNVNNATSIVNAFNAIITRTASCTLGLTATGTGTQDPSVLTVELVRNNGAMRTVIVNGANGYTLSGNTLMLNGQACTNLQNAVATDSTARVEVKIGCACTPSTEICTDTKDNDCDGLVNEGCVPTNICGMGAPAADCEPPTPPPPEQCDGMDNDGDGVVDEGCPGPCSMARDEVCDGADNDCDMQIDEGCPPMCTPQPEICDERDNDCDTIVDEGCGEVCHPLTEICDELDNDCNGEIDEICPTGPILG